MKTPDLAIVGGGLLGRLLAWRAALDGYQVSVFDANERRGSNATAWVAAGMVTPQAEAAEADPELVSMGRRSLTLWPKWLAQLFTPVYYCSSGTLLVWQRADAGEAARFERLLKLRDPFSSVERLSGNEVGEKEPMLHARFREALYLPNEAHVDNRGLLPSLADSLDALNVNCQWNTPIPDTERPNAHLVVDCRGKSARTRWKELRGVRGEIVRLHAPGVELKRMIRLLHPRYHLYVISRPGGNVVVGATSIESEDSSPVSVHGALELLSAAYTVLPELGEARILELNSDCRPAFPDNRPALRYSPDDRVLEVNGLYRHGFLLSPAIVEELLIIIPLLLRNPARTIRHSWPSSASIANPEVLLCQ